MPVTSIVLIVYLLIILLITYFSYRNIENFTDFFVARKKGNLFTITGSLVATILGGSAIIGAINEGPLLGWATSWYMLSASLGLWALLPLVAKVSRRGRYTLPGLLGDMYTPNVKVISTWIISAAWLGIIAAQIIAAAKILQSFTGMSYSIGVICSGVVFILYTFAGGQVSILKTDLFQSILILAGLFLLIIFIPKDLSIPSFASTTKGFPFNQHFSPIDLFILLMTYSTTFTFGPDIYSRIFCANNEKTAQRAVLATAILLIPVAFSIGFISTSGSQLFQNNNNGSLLIDISNSVLPSWGVAIIAISLLSTVLSSADTTILSTSIMMTDLIEKGIFGKETLKKTRIAIFITGIMSIIIALNFKSIIGILLIALTAYSGAFIIPLLTGLLGYQVKPKYLITALIIGGLMALSGKILFYAGLASIGNAFIITAFFANGFITLLGVWNNGKNNRSDIQ